jgi:flagellar protein FliS
MKEEIAKVFTTRIAQANRSELVVILYDIILESLDEAEEFWKEGREEEFERELSRAQKGLRELIATLDMQYDVSRQLMPLYLYANRKLVDALRRKRPEPLKEARLVLKPLGTSFREVAKQDSSPALMEHTQQVYAGLTYGRGTLNETILSGQSRGFKA